MIKNLKLKIKNFSKGITLVEIVVVVFIISLFSMILISDYPKIQRQFALSRSAYKLAQDLRKIQGLGLSGVLIKDRENILVTGYGIYINTNLFTTKYLTYADVGPGENIAGNHMFDGNFNTDFCSDTENLTEDCVMEIVNVNQEDLNVYIKQININNVNADYASINFRPPNPTIDISNLNEGYSGIDIVLGLVSDTSATRTVQVNTSGLINVQ